VVGLTSSPDFPVTPLTAYQATPWGQQDGFLVQLSSDLSQLDYSSYVGGGRFDNLTGVHVSAPRILTCVGVTHSDDFPVTPATAVQASNANDKGDYLVCRFDLDQPPGSQLLYGTYLGGSDTEGYSAATLNGVFSLKSPDMHVDAAGRVTLVGRTLSSDAPVTADAFQSTLDGSLDAYLARVDPSVPGMSGLTYATFVGGASGQIDNAWTLAVDAAGVVTLGGYTYSEDFPNGLGATPGAFQEQHASPGGTLADAFLARLDPSASPPANQLVYATFLGGGASERLVELQLDASGRIIAQGGTDSGVGVSFPVTCGAFQSQPGSIGEWDGYVVYLDPAGQGASDLLYSTRVGGFHFDRLHRGLLVASEAPTLKVLATGESDSIDFPTTAGALQPNNAGQRDCVLLQLEIDASYNCTVSYCTAGTSASGCAATLSAAGDASATAPSGFVLTASGAEGAKDGLFFFGTSGRQASPWGNGTSFQCVVPPVKRAGLLTGVGTPGLCDGSFAQDLNALWCPTCPKPQKNPGAGATVQAQLWYRDPFNTSNQTTSLSDAIEFSVGS